MNPEDYKLIPLDDVAASPALKASYIEMMRRIHHKFWHGTIDDCFAPIDAMCQFPSFHEIENGFEDYLDYLHHRGTWKTRSNGPARVMALVNTQENTICGEAGFYTDCGYDVIDPDRRGKGLGNLILALRLEKAKELGMSAITLSVRADNWRSNRRMEKLAAAGLIQSSWQEGEDFVSHTVPLRPEHTRQTYLNAMLLPRNPFGSPVIEPLSP